MLQRSRELPATRNTSWSLPKLAVWLFWPWGRASLLSLAGVVLVLKDLAPADGGTEGEEDASGDASVKSECSLCGNIKLDPLSLFAERLGMTF